MIYIFNTLHRYLANKQQITGILNELLLKFKSSPDWKLVVHVCMSNI